MADWSVYPFSVPAIAGMREVNVRSRICFFVGENGSGKSTLLEAIAESYGFGREGGSRNFRSEAHGSSDGIATLAGALRIAFTKRSGQGFYLRAESFFNIATQIDDLGLQAAYGDKSLHQQSHGESFLALLQYRFRRRGFYILDEPEAALSPQRQLAFLAMLRDLLECNSENQILIATHSPILLAYPGAQILSFDGGTIRETTWKETSAYQVVARFLARPEVFLNEIFGSDPPAP